MERVKVIDGLLIGCPEGFRVLGKEEMKEMKRI